MPYLTAQSKTMGRHQALTTLPVNRESIGELPALPHPAYHPLPSQPQAPSNHVFRPGGFGGEVGRYQFGYGQYRYGQNFSGQQYQEWPYTGRSWQQHGDYGTRDQYTSTESQGTFNYWRKPGAHAQSVYPSPQAHQGWQRDYYGQFQQYAHSPHYLPCLPLVQHGEMLNQDGLTQQWQTADNALGQLGGGPPTTPLDASAATFKPQEPLKSVPAAELNRQYRVDKESRYARSKPNTRYNNSKLEDGDVALVQPSAGQSMGADAAPWYIQTAHRAAPAAYTRSFTRATTTAPPQPQPIEPPTSNPRLYLLKRPIPSAEYMMRATEDPETLAAPRPVLVILDLNGTLLFRKNRGSNFKARPFVNEFLQYLFRYHHVMIWSSAKPHNVEAMTTKLIDQDKDKLIAVWSRDDLRLPKHAYNEKVQVYKQLSWVWSNLSVQAKAPAPWSQGDTVLIDDSIEKAVSEPYNLVQIEEFEAKPTQMKVDVLGQVVSYLETLRWQKDVSAYMRSKPFVFDAEMSFDWKPFVGDEK